MTSHSNNTSNIEIDKSIYPLLYSLIVTLYSILILLILLDPIDCDSDPCHLAWLLRDNRHLLQSVYNGTCSSLVRFEDIDPKTKFELCPVN